MCHFRVQIAKFSTRKMCFKSKSQKNVPANNCHLKVIFLVNGYINCIYLFLLFRPTLHSFLRGCGHLAGCRHKSIGVEYVVTSPIAAGRKRVKLYSLSKLDELSQLTTTLFKAALVSSIERSLNITRICKNISFITTLHVLRNF